jgi:hypothetical protein
MIKQLSLLFLTVMCFSLSTSGLSDSRFTRISVHCAFPSLCFSDILSIFQNIHLIFFDSNFVNCLWLLLSNTLSPSCDIQKCIDKMPTSAGKIWPALEEADRSKHHPDHSKIRPTIALESQADHLKYYPTMPNAELTMPIKKPTRPYQWTSRLLPGTGGVLQWQLRPGKEPDHGTNQEPDLGQKRPDPKTSEDATIIPIKIQPEHVSRKATLDHSNQQHDHY